MAEMNRQMEAGNVQLAWFRTQEEYLAWIDKLRLIDDDFFGGMLHSSLIQPSSLYGGGLCYIR